MVRLKSLKMVALTVIVLLAFLYLHSQVEVHPWRSGTGEATGPTHPLMGFTKGQALPSAAAQQADRRQQPTAQRSAHSGNSSGQVADRIFHELEAEFERRRNVLLRGCKEAGTFPSHPWKHGIRFTESFSVCVNHKVGLHMFWKMKELMSEQKPARPQNTSVAAIIVRHPLSRLVSGYRDKFLNGNPVSAYNDDWRRKTQSGERWTYRFVLYWAPALISQGLLPLASENTRKFLADQKRLRTTKTGGAVPQYFTEMMDRFMNVSFTFSQYLEYVVWSYDNNMVNEHWRTYTKNCAPCRWKFDYILKLETIQEEMNHLLYGVLGYHKRIQVPVLHHTPGQSDGHYYANVSHQLMERVLDIYKHDFTLFGYEHVL